MLRMKCSAYWVISDIPHIYLLSELHIISSEIVVNVEKNQSDKKILFIRKKSRFFQLCLAEWFQGSSLQAGLEFNSG